MMKIFKSIKFKEKNDWNFLKGNVLNWQFMQKGHVTVAEDKGYDVLFFKML